MLHCFTNRFGGYYTLLEQLKTLQMLETKEKQLQGKISAKAEKAKEYAKLQNKNGKLLLYV